MATRVLSNARRVHTRPNHNTERAAGHDLSFYRTFSRRYLKLTFVRRVTDSSRRRYYLRGAGFRVDSIFPRGTKPRELRVRTSLNYSRA